MGGMTDQPVDTNEEIRTLRATIAQLEGVIAALQRELKGSVSRPAVGGLAWQVDEESTFLLYPGAPMPLGINRWGRALLRATLTELLAQLNDADLQASRVAHAQNTTSRIAGNWPS